MTTGDVNVTVFSVMVDNSNLTVFTPTLHELNIAEVRRRFPTLVFLVIICLAGIVGNSLVCHVYRSFRHLSNTQYFTIWLAAIDLFSCSVNIPLQIVIQVNAYEFEHAWLCKLSRFCNTWTTVSASTMLLAIATERYMKVCRPHGWQINISLAKHIGVPSVMLALVFSWPSLIVYGTYTFELTKYKIIATECSTDDAMLKTIYPLIFASMLGGLFIFGILYICVMYCLIGRKARLYRMTLNRPMPTVLSTTIRSDSSIEVERNPNSLSTVRTRKERACTSSFTHPITKWSMAHPNDGDIRSDHIDHDESNASLCRGVDTSLLTDTAICRPDDRGVHVEGNTVRGVHASLDDVGDMGNKTESREDTTLSNKPDIAIKSSSLFAIGRIFSCNQANPVSIANTPKPQKRNETRGRKITIQMCAISIAFVLSYMPHLVLLIVRGSMPGFEGSMSDEGWMAYIFFHDTYFLNCAINPIIYGVCDTRFRDALKVVFFKRCNRAKSRGTNNRV